MRHILFALLVFPLCMCAQPARIKPPTKPQATVPTRPTTGTLSITSIPSDAVIEINGEYMGTTPLTLKNRKAGTYRITFSAKGYETQTLSVTVIAGKTATCSATLPKSLQTFTVNGVSFRMIRVEGGTFQMGATSEQDSYADDEKPVHSVTLSSYYIGQTEVTQALWQAVMGSNPSRFSGSNLPVEKVSWEDCQTFITRLNQLTGQKFRLPTEAEWEYAARGGKNSKGYKYSGSNTLGDVAWYTDNSGSKTHPVATKQANELGLYDMSGNIWEWCQDWKGSYSSSSQTNPTGPSSGFDRVNRGGGWNDGARYCRASYRSNNAPSFRFFSLGLRLALSE